MQRFGQRFGLFVLTIFFVRTPLISEKFWEIAAQISLKEAAWSCCNGTEMRYFGVGSFCTYAGLFCLPKWPVRHGETLEFMMKMSVMSISFLMLIEVWTSQKRVLFSGGSLCWAGACLPSKCARGCMAWRYTERNGLSMVSKRMAGADLWSIADFVMFGLVLFLRRVVILFRKLCKRSGHLRLASGDCLQFS